MNGVDVQAEQEPEGEMLVGIGGEAFIPPGMNTTIRFLSLSWCIWAAAPFVVICFTLGALWSPGEPEEDKGETEEPQVCAPEQFKFDWACTWWRKVGHLQWMRIRLSACFLRYKWVLLKPYSS